MRKVYTWSHGVEDRNLTIADMRANKAAGRRMTQVTAGDAEEASIIAGAGIDMIITGSDAVRDVRRGAPNTFLTAALFAGRYATDEEILRGAIDAAMAGADSVLTPRSMRVVELLAKEGLMVQGHVGMVPSLSILLGGMRARGRTASEALEIFEEMRRLEDAGAFGAEVECVAEDALREISRHTSLITNSIGAGAGGDVIFLFFPDICGETENPPRHAKAWGDGLSIKRALAAERARAAAGFRADVMSGTYPAAAHTVTMNEGERERLAEALDKRVRL